MTLRRRPIFLLLLTLAILVTAGLVRGSLSEVADLFGSGRYAEAREVLSAESGANTTPGAARIWEQRLQTDPDRASELALDQSRNRDIAPALRVQAALDGATIELARQHPEGAWQILQPLLALETEGLPGEVYLLAGEILRQSGDRQRAREMLASVRPEDPAFVPARALLGRIGLESGDSELALRYFESTQRHVDGPARSDLLAGRWQALRLLGRDLEARDTADQLLRDFPSSPAAMEVREQQRRDADELDAFADTMSVEAPEALAPSTTARYAVQLAAFRDRSLALQFVARWQPEISDLRVVRVDDDLDQPVYKVQTGSFVSRAQARTAVSRIAREHGLEGFVAGSGE